MKYLMFTAVAVLVTAFGFAQDCKQNLYMTNNAKIQMTMYDKKGKESGVQTWTVSNVKKTGAAYQSTINTSMTDEKGQVMSTATGSYKCNGGVLSADVRMSMPQGGEGAKPFKPTNASLDPVYLEYPASPSVGQALTGADFKMDVEMNTGMKAAVSFKEEDRKVASKESVTSPAGTWDAYVITYDAVMKTQMGPLGIPFNFSVKEWYVPGTGVVKSETYNKKGKLLGSSLITSISK